MPRKTSKAQRRGRIAEFQCIGVAAFLGLFYPTVTRAGSVGLWIIFWMFAAMGFWLLSIAITGYFNISLFKRLGIKAPTDQESFPRVNIGIESKEDQIIPRIKRI